MTNSINIDQAAFRLMAAKAAEQRAAAERIAAEEALARLLPQKDEGTVSEKTDQFKVAVTYGLRRTVDEAALDAVRKELPPALFARLFRFKPEVSVRELKYVQNNEPELYAITAQAITARPGKPSVRVELVDAVHEAAKAA